MSRLFACALSCDGQIKCWGNNDMGQLGLGDTVARGGNPSDMGSNLPVVDLGLGRTGQSIAAEVDHVCAVLDQGQVKCWGDNRSGQLGLGDSNSRGASADEMADNLPFVELGAGRTATSVATGTGSSCALLDNGQVKCWGANDSGQLGLGDLNSRGALADEMGDHLPTVDLGSGRTATAITAGGGHTCALLDDQTLKCWGKNHSGQLGLGDVDNRGDVAGEMGDNLPVVDLGAERFALVVSAGSAHTCAALDNGQIKCWGDFSAGQLGLGEANYRGKRASDMGDNLPGVDLGAGRTGIDVSAGPEHTCAVLDNHQSKCWGLNHNGSLGIGDTQLRGKTPSDMGDNLPEIALGTARSALTVVAGVGSNCALLDNDQVKCWGGNGSGELGIGDTTDRGASPSDMGDNLPELIVW